MALVSFLDLIRHARQHSYALSVISVRNLTELFTAVDAAQTQRAPLVIAPSVDTANELNARALFAACEAAAQQASVPIALLGTRIGSADDVIANINAGCMALHVELAPAPFPDIVAAAKTLVQIAKQCGIAAGGLLQDFEGGKAAQDPGLRTPVAEAVAFAERAELDFLEVQIGTHSIGASGRAKIDFERLKRIHDATGLPLLIRSGGVLAPEQIHRLREHGVTLVLHELPEGQSGEPAISSLLNAWGSSGRAAEVFEHSRLWDLVEHVIEFNVQADALASAEEMLRVGREQLSTIPGVRRVVTGKAVTDQAKYRFCWIVTFANHKVIDVYRDHPVHVQFANTHFRPIAGDRITIDFEHI